MPQPLVAGNWKMNGTKANLPELVAIDAHAKGKSAGVLICTPATLIGAAVDAASAIAIGGQDAHHASSGAHTGDISAEMLADTGATYVILGHSERRTDHGESDSLVADKTKAVWAADLSAIICVGETREEREAGDALSVVAAQLDASVPTGASAANTVIAYEPVWAIGTGLIPTMGDIAAMHDMIRAHLAKIGVADANETRILYGGSMKASNASEISALENVDGGLVGGASLTAEAFTPIIDAFSA